MGKLGFILGGVALAATGYGLKKWYDKTKEENAYWTDDPKDIACEMLGQAIENNLELKEKYEQTCANIKKIFENANPSEIKDQKMDNF
ncbi:MULTISPECIES: hypothetical protein [Campylobacter]|uniref:hypothetical protein n=1 Tax=Campylobacter TaxID=194 RepID=UPI00127029C8|nr:hypothetical protein [Campylobacter lari]MBT0815256.1 hypothetical protein [Campylobacter lari]MCR8676942.1 hypothetical protein [Campylobacter sp. S4:11]